MTSLQRTTLSFKSRLAPLALLVVLASLPAMILTSSDAEAAPLRVGARAVPGTEKVAVDVHGARGADGVALYVDGRLAQRDNAWPWTFGRDGHVPVGSGRHAIAVSARLHRRTEVRRRTVVVKAPDAAEAPAEPPAASPESEQAPKTSGSGRSRKPSAPSAPTAPSPPPVAPAEPVSPPAAPTPPPSSQPGDPLDGGSVVWSGDFETDSIRQWEVAQEVASNRITIVKDPAAQGSYAARFEVRPGDEIGDTPPRAELATDLHEKEGEERYYRWYTYFPESFPTNYPDSFITFTQWRAKDESDAYTSFMVWGDQIQLRRGGTRWSTTLTKDVWHKFVYHVKWSPDPNVGFIELWYDGQLVLPRVYTQTMAGTPGHAVGNYVKEGLYKSPEIPTGVLYQDGFVSGTSYAAVNGA